MLLDTSGLVCCFDQSENRHAEATRLFRSARWRLTHSCVLAEFLPVCRARGLHVDMATVALLFAIQKIDCFITLDTAGAQAVHRTGCLHPVALR